MAMILKYPATPSPKYKLRLDPGLAFDFRFDDHEAQFARERHSVVFTIRGIASESEADAYIARLRYALYWVTLHCEAPFVTEDRLASVVMRRNWATPERPADELEIEPPVRGGDGIVQANGPYLFPEGARLRSAFAFAPDVSIGVSPERLAQTLEEGLALGLRQPMDERVLTALQLYSAAQDDGSLRTRFLTRIMALEALSRPVPLGPAALTYFQKWKSELELAIKSRPAGEAGALQRFADKFFARPEESISSALQNLVRSVLNASGSPEVESAVATVKRLYDHRSRLLHDGVIDSKELAWSDGESKRLCRSVLECVMREGITPTA